jgi:tetratricopeptide (TPR) repeat protein
LLVARRLLGAQQADILQDVFEKENKELLRRELTTLLETAARKLGPDHLDTATVMEQLGRAGRDPGETAKHLEPCLTIRALMLGPSHPDTVRVQHFLGLCYQHLQQYDRAIPLLERSVESITAAGQRGYYWLGQVLTSLAISYGHTQQFDKAESLHLQSLEVAEASQSTIDVVSTLANLGGLYIRARRLEKAEACLSRGLGLLQRNPGLPWMPFANVLLGLASALAEAGQAERAEAMYVQCVRLCCLHFTTPPGRPWQGRHGGIMSTLMKAAGAPDDLVEREMVKENLITEVMMGVFFPGRSGTATDRPKEPS